jgi:hypothetical protein
MRFAFAASSLCFGLLLFAAHLALPQTAAPAAAPAAPTASSAPATAQPSAALPLSDAASKHAKRTACLKDARDKKLVGADRTAYLKACNDAP